MGLHSSAICCAGRHECPDSLDSGAEESNETRPHSKTLLRYRVCCTRHNTNTLLAHSMNGITHSKLLRDAFTDACADFWNTNVPFIILAQCDADE